MNPTSSPTSNPPCKIQHLDTVKLSIPEEAHAEQDQHVLEMLRVLNVPDESLDGPNLLSIQGQGALANT
ncbi:hypothetical protein K439DRAFT_1630315 [Ramaria rubella]|nr:hypothetical protein K439DRAFT_1630315 [Ramaria rubella]